MTIEELATLMHVSIRVTYINDWSENKHLPDPSADRWYANLDDAEIKDGCMLCGMAGYGANPEEAVRRLCQTIQGKLLIINAGGSRRREFRVPMTIERGATK